LVVEEVVVEVLVMQALVVLEALGGQVVLVLWHQLRVVMVELVGLILMWQQLVAQVIIKEELVSLVEMWLILAVLLVGEVLDSKDVVVGAMEEAL
jgi:hypothetical protein